MTLYYRVLLGLYNSYHSQPLALPEELVRNFHSQRDAEKIRLCQIYGPFKDRMAAHLDLHVRTHTIDPVEKELIMELPSAAMPEMYNVDNIEDNVAEEVVTFYKVRYGDEFKQHLLQDHHCLLATINTDSWDLLASEKSYEPGPSSQSQSSSPTLVLREYHPKCGIQSRHFYAFDPYVGIWRQI